MLPSPIGTRSRRWTNGRQQGLGERLSARSRVTNLGIVLLLIFLSLSLLLNVRHVLLSTTSSFLLSPSADTAYRLARLGGPGAVGAAGGGWPTPKSLLDSLPDAGPATVDGGGASGKGAGGGLDHLIIVAGHAIWTGCSYLDRENDDKWILEPYQEGGSVSTFYKHIQKGVEMMLADERSLLVFSGGQTRNRALLTEAESYLHLTLSSPLLTPPTSDPKSTLHPYHPRITTENFALDSYENLLFSLARFREVTGRYPTKVTIVGYGMKKERFERLHRAAVRWPLVTDDEGRRATTWEYVGIDDEGDTSDAYQGELANGFTKFQRDLYGCHDTLSAKRQSRNPFRRFHGYHFSAPELSELLEWCPPLSPNGDVSSQVFPGVLPWDAGWASERQRVKVSFGRERT